MARKQGRNSGGTQGLEIMNTPLRVPPMKRDVTPGYNIPPRMNPRDPLGNLPKGSLDGKRGR